MWFKKKENGQSIDMTKAYTTIDGEDVPISELLKHKKENDEKAAAAEAEEKEKAAREKHRVDEKDEIEHEGTRHKMSDLVRGWKSTKLGMDAKGKKNGTTEKGDPLPEDADKVKKDNETMAELSRKSGKVIEDTPMEKPKQDDPASAVTAEEKNLPKNNEAEEKKEDGKVIDAEPSENPKCTCNAKEEEEHKENCPVSKKNESEEKKKEEAEESDKEHSKKKNEEEEEKKETIKKEDSKKDSKWFKKLNALREEGSEEKAIFCNTLKDRFDRGNDRYGSKKETA